MKSAAAAAPSRPSAATGGKCGPVAASKVSRKRGFVLVAIHLAILVHVAQWKISGTTVTPVEPSEAMQTLELGYVNAGFVLFLVALAATAVFGRFFCGWACHVVAYQDACGWLMGKLGVRPRPFRSRLLAYVPLIAGLYMFVWPTLKRHVNMAAATPEPLRRLLDWPKADFWFEAYRRPEFRAAFFTDDFWATFPDFWMATLTVLVCGPLIVWFLGNKGFCTYGCPYGGLFGVADRLAPARIRVTDACEGCGHCTAVCTSNVRVHEEVKLYKAVVDPQCMKCLDCVSVCPKDALYVGFGAPALLTRAAPKKPVRSYDLGFGAEAALAAVFAAAVFAYRSLYDDVPFLLSLGLAALTAFAARVVWNMARGRGATIQNVKLLDGRRPTGAGLAYGAVLLAFLGFGAHAFYVQWNDLAGRRRLLAYDELAAAGKAATPEARAALDGADAAFSSALGAAAGEMRRATLLAGRAAFAREDYPKAAALISSALSTAGRGEDAAYPMSATQPPDLIRLDRAVPEDVLKLAMARGAAGDLAGAVADAETYLRLRPENPAAKRMLEAMRKSLGGG